MNQSTPLKRTSFTRKMPDNAIKPSPGKRKNKCGNKLCRQPFVPNRSFEKHCSPECGFILSQELIANQKVKKEKAERAEDKKKLEEFKPLAYWERIAERYCNEYIRLRDPDVCISCGVMHSSAWQAGHYISVGANKTLRYVEENINKQCINCNMFKGSNAIEYRKGMLEKWGQEKLDWLEGWHSPLKLTKEYLQEVAEYYKGRIKSLKNIEN